jgi:hypothetical protein
VAEIAGQSIRAEHTKEAGAQRRDRGALNAEPGGLVRGAEDDVTRVSNINRKEEIPV